MRTVLLLSIVTVLLSGCAPAARAPRLGWSYSGLPPVEIYQPDPTAASRPRIVIAREVLDGWNFLYLHITDTEFALCLEGSRNGEALIITGFRLAHILVSNFNGIKYEPCFGGATYVGVAHNHPPADYPGENPCYQSPMDERSFRNDRRAHVDIVICGRDRFVWALKDDRGPHVWQPTGSSRLVQK